MTTIKLGGKELPMDWTFMSVMYMESAQATMDSVGNVGKVAIMAVAALRGANYNFDKGPDWVLQQIGKDAKKMKELSDKVYLEYQAFLDYNKAEVSEGNAEATEEVAKN